MLRAALFALLLVAAVARASPVYTLAEPWVRPAAAGAATELYVELRASEAATLIAVTTGAAARVELLDRRGKVVPAIELPAATLVRLEPGAARVRLAGLPRPLARGGHVPLMLTVRDGTGAIQEIPVEAEVRLHSPSHDHGVAHTH